jgi:hypothetical protein
MDGQAEPTFTLRAIWLPVTAVWVASFKVTVGNGFIRVFKANHRYFQSLRSNPGFHLLTVAFIEVRHVRVSKHAVSVAHDWGWLDQNSFFRHGCSFAAIAAVFERGELKLTGGQAA